MTQMVIPLNNLHENAQDIHTLIQTGVAMTLSDEYVEDGETSKVYLHFSNGILNESEGDQRLIGQTIKTFNLDQYIDLECIDIPVRLESGMFVEELFNCLTLPHKLPDLHLGDSYPRHPKLQEQSFNHLIRPFSREGEPQFKIQSVNLKDRVVTVSVAVSTGQDRHKELIQILSNSYVEFCFLKFKDQYYGVGNGWIIPNSQ